MPTLEAERRGDNWGQRTLIIFKEDIGSETKPLGNPEGGVKICAM